MSLNHLTNVDDDSSQSLNIGCQKIKADELILHNDDQTLTTFNFANQGIASYTLHTDGTGGTYWAPDDTSAGGMAYAGINPVTVGTHYKISSTNGEACVDSKLQETATDLNLQNLKVTNATDPTNPQDLATKAYVDANENPFDQSLNTTDSVEFTNELVVQNGINSDNFYFKDEETKCIIQHKVSGVKYNILEGLNDGTISIGDTTISNANLNLNHDNTFCGSVKLQSGYSSLSYSIGEDVKPYGQVYTNELDLRTVGLTDPSIKINGSAGSNGQILVTNGSNQISWADQPYDIIVPCSDNSTPLTTGTGKASFRTPRGFTFVVKASVITPQTSGSILTIDIKKNGTTIFAVPLTIDNNETTSVTAVTQPNYNTTGFSADDLVTIDITQVGTGATGLKVTFLGKI